MQKNFSLTISKPCSEKFSEFEATDVGGFCNSCQKEVIDFTKMSDNQILEYFKNGQKNTCGRLLESQLKAYSAIVPSKKKWSLSLLGAGFISLVSLFSANNSYAQQSGQPSTIQKSQKEDKKQQNTDSQTNSNERIIKGIVISADDKSALPGVSVVLKGSTIGTYTDVDGKFKFSKSLQEGDVLIFSFVGFNTQEIVISQKISNSVSIILEMNFQVMGEVSINEVYTSKRSFWQKLKGIFR